MFFLFLAIFIVAFLIITWRNFNAGLFLLFLLLPTYLIRFDIGPLPTTLLEVMLWIVIGIFTTQTILNRIKKNKKLQSSVFSLHIFTLYPFLIIGITLFLLGATISIFTAVDIRSALGEWKAFYVEPVLLALILLLSNTSPTKGSIRQEHSIFTSSPYEGEPTTAVGEGVSMFARIAPLASPLIGGILKAVVFGLVFSALATSILAIVQHFTGWLVPEAFWANGDTFRVTAWYGFPNAVGLFIAPLVPLALYIFIQKLNLLQRRNLKFEMRNLVILISCFLFLISAPLAIIFAKSTGALIGLITGLGLLLVMNKKTRWWNITLATCTIGAIVLLPLLGGGWEGVRSIKDELTFQDRSGQIRVAIYKETIALLKDHPIRGAGLASYSERITPYHTTVNGEGIEIFHHPHNIFLTIWVNTGLVGLIGFVLILVWFYTRIAYHITRNNEQSPISNHKSLFLLASMTTLLVSGLVDSPYIKNDLAVLFWILIALLIISSYENQNLENPATEKTR